MGRIRRSLVILALIAAAPVPAVAPARADESAQGAALAEALADEFDYRVQVQAALAMGEVADPSVIPHLVEALDDAHPLVRAAAESLARRRCRRSGAPPQKPTMAREAVENAVRRSSPGSACSDPCAASGATPACTSVGDPRTDPPAAEGMADELRSALVARLRRMRGVIGARGGSDEVLAHRLASVRSGMLTGSITDVAPGPMTVSVYVKVRSSRWSIAVAIRTMSRTATSRAVKERACRSRWTSCDARRTPPPRRPSTV